MFFSNGINMMILFYFIFIAQNLSRLIFIVFLIFIYLLMYLHPICIFNSIPSFILHFISIFIPGLHIPVIHFSSSYSNSLLFFFLPPFISFLLTFFHAIPFLIAFFCFNPFFHAFYYYFLFAVYSFSCNSFISSFTHFCAV